MHDPVPVSEVQGVSHFPGDPDGVFHRQLALAAQSVAKALAFHEWHGEPQAASGFTRVEDSDDMRMLKTSGETNFLFEAIGPEGGRDLVVEDLQRDRTIVPEVMREKHGGKAAASEFTLDPVLTRELRREGRQVFTDGWGPGALSRQPGGRVNDIRRRVTPAMASMIAARLRIGISWSAIVTAGLLIVRRAPSFGVLYQRSVRSIEHIDAHHAGYPGRVRFRVKAGFSETCPGCVWLCVHSLVNDSGGSGSLAISGTDIDAISTLGTRWAGGSSYGDPPFVG